jgi:hypothetical protein
MTVAVEHGICIQIGGIAISVSSHDAEFLGVLRDRYGHFVQPSHEPDFQFEIDIQPGRGVGEGVQVWRQGRMWHMTRGDFEAEWDPDRRTGVVRQGRNRYGFDSVLRIVHSLVLARRGGFLLHSASVIRNGTAFLFSGVSGVGKTTISSLAPADVTLLTDEISYVGREQNQYRAYGTPFAGELAKIGENVSAPLKALYFLAQGPENRIEPLKPTDAAAMLLRNTLFFAHEPELVRMVFNNACEFACRVQPSRLTFTRDRRVWELIH